MKTEFHEDFLSEHQDALDGQTGDFDWNERTRALGEEQVEVHDRDYEAMGHAFRVLLQWVLKVSPAKPCSERTIARRLIGLAWTIDPGLIEGSPSVSQIARELDCHKVALSVHTAHAHRHFGIKNRAQSHGWNFKTAKAPKTPQNESGASTTLADKQKQRSGNPARKEKANQA